MRRILVLLSFLFASTAYSQTWTTVDPPNAPLLPLIAPSYNVGWNYPFDTPCPAGTYEITNLVMDRSQQMGVRSQPKVIKAKAGWDLFGGTWNQPTTKDDVGIVWIVKCIDVQEAGAFKNGAELLFSANLQPSFSVAPYSGDSPYVQRLGYNWNGYRILSPLKKNGRNTVVAPPPIAFPSAFPYKSCEVAYCRVTETGETALSPWQAVNMPLPAAVPGVVTPKVPEVCYFGLHMENDPHPQGTIGYHVYVRFAPGEVCQRLPAPHCVDEPVTPDDWLFQIWDNQPIFRKLAATKITHQPVAQPQSRLNWLQLALKNENGNIIVRPAVLSQVQFDCYCPVIDEWGSGANKSYRRIFSEDQGKWKLVQQQSQSGHTYWPMLCVQNAYSSWENASVQGTKGASAALTYSGWSGGQSFGNKFTNCLFNTNKNNAGITYGLLISDNCSRWQGDHTVSEQLYASCQFAGGVGVSLEGNQTANIQFKEQCYVNGYGDRRGSAFWNTAPSQVDVTGGMYCDSSSGVIFRAGWLMNYNIDKLWVDAGFDHFIDCYNNAGINMTIANSKLNAWGDYPNLVRLVEPSSDTVLMFDKVVCQMNPPFVLLANAPQYNSVDLRFTNSNLADLLVLREPTETQVAQQWPLFMRSDIAYPKNRPVLGFKLMVPEQTVNTPPFKVQTVPISQSVSMKINGATTATKIPINIPPQTVDIPSQKIVVPSQPITFNSLTGRQNVKRADWWADPILLKP